jgi:hypothetical protein
MSESEVEQLRLEADRKRVVALTAELGAIRTDATALCAKYLASVFALLGSEYDFRFDFGEATYQCCTEVIYRCMNGLGTTNFELTPRLGTPTLSADDIVNHHLAADGGVFDVVLLATHNDAADTHDAVLHVGTAAEVELRRIMAR